MVLLLLLLLLDVDGIRDKGRKGIPVAPVGLTACNFSRHEAIKNFFRGPSPLANRLANSRQSSQCSQRSNFCFSASFLFLFPACSLLHPSKSRDPAIIYTKGGGGRGEKGTSINIYSAAIPPDHYPPEEGVGRDNPASNPPLPSDPSFARKI